MANKGTFDDTTLMSESTWDDFHSEARVEYELPFGERTAFTKGGVSKFGFDAVKSTPRTYDQIYLPKITERNE
jgi:hypothetical protein